MNINSIYGSIYNPLDHEIIHYQSNGRNYDEFMEWDLKVKLRAHLNAVGIEHTSTDPLSVDELIEMYRSHTYLFSGV